MTPYVTGQTHVFPDPGQPNLGKRDSLKQDYFDKAFKDDQARVVYKVDMKDHGLWNGGVVYQTTHGRTAGNKMAPKTYDLKE